MLVKWRLLAIPHYLIVGLFTSGLVWWTMDIGDNGAFADGWGLIGILVLVAGVALLVTGRYPQGLFDLVMGLNRWSFRVGAYVTLMTDQYPPFRLDLGGSEGGPEVPSRPLTRAPAARPREPTTHEELTEHLGAGGRHRRRPPRCEGAGTGQQDRNHRMPPSRSGGTGALLARVPPALATAAGTVALVGSPGFRSWAWM